MGPLILLNSMKYETKHAFFTQVAKTTKSFVNVQKTMSLKHQSHIKFSINDNKINQIDTGKLFLLDEHILEENKDILLLQFKDSADLFTAKWAKNGSNKYKEQLIVIFNSGFYKSNTIILKKGVLYFLCIYLLCDGFDEFLNAFCVKSAAPNIRRLINYSQIACQRPLEIKEVNGKQYILADTLEILRNVNF